MYMTKIVFVNISCPEHEQNSFNKGNTTDYSRSGLRLCDNIVSGLVSDNGGISSHTGGKNVKYYSRPAYLDTDAKMSFICW